MPLINHGNILSTDSLPGSPPQPKPARAPTHWRGARPGCLRAASRLRPARVDVAAGLDRCHPAARVAGEDERVALQREEARRRFSIQGRVEAIERTPRDEP